VQECRELRGRIRPHRGQGVGIDIERDVDPFVAEPFLHHFDRHIGLQQ
jgi:hypothetical protein